jgi:hypothetical protein
MCKSYIYPEDCDIAAALSEELKPEVGVSEVIALSG